MLSYTTFSQTDIKNKVILDSKIARNVAKELIECDTLKIRYSQLNKLNNLLNVKTELQDNKIKLLDQKILNLSDINLKLKDENDIISNINKNLTKDLRKQKIKTGIYKTTSGILSIVTLISIGVILGR